MGQDRRLQPLQPRTRLDPQLLGQHPPSLPEGLQRLRLAAVAIQGQHQLPPEPLPEWMLLQHLADPADHLGVPAQRQRRLELLLQRVDPQRLQPGGLRADPRAIRQALQRPPTPQRQRAGDQLCGLAGVTRPPGAASPGQQLLEPQGVHGGSRQRVHVRGGNDRLGSKRGAEPRNVVLHGITRRRRDLRPPQGVDQHLDRHHTTTPQGQQRQQRAPPGAGDLRGATSNEDLERSQKPDLKRGHSGNPSDASGSVWHAPTHL